MEAAANLERLLQSFLQPHNENRKQDEKLIVNLLKQRESVGVFLAVINGSPDVGVRQLAATLLRKKVSNVWRKLSPEEQAEVKRVLLDRILSEPHRLVRAAIAHLTSVVGKLTIPMGQWPELLAFLFQCTQSSEASHREIGMVLLFALSETVEEQMRPHLPNLIAVFRAGLSDAEMPVRLATLRAITPLMSGIEEEAELQACSVLFSPMMDVLGQCIEQFTQTTEDVFLDIALQIFEVLDDILELEMATQQYLPAFLAYMLRVASNRAAHAVIRERATAFLGGVIAEKPKLVTKLDLVEPLLKLILETLVSMYPKDIFDREEFEDEDDDHAASELQFTTALLEAMGVALPNKVIFPKVFDWAQQQILNPSEPPFKKAAILAVSLIAKGCRDAMRPAVEVVLKMLQACFGTDDSQVREAASYSMVQFAEYLQPEILLQYEKLMPHIFSALEDPNEKVRQKMCFTLEAVGENLGRDLEPFLPRIMDLLVKNLSTSSKTQGVAVSAIGSVAMGVEEAFTPYVGRTFEMLRMVMQSTEDEHLPLRARATECVGIIAAACGRKVFEPFFPDFLTLVMQGLELGDLELTEYTFGFFANMAEMMEEDWRHHAGPTMEPLLDAIDQEDGETRPKPSVFASPQVELSDSDSDDDDEEGDIRGWRVRTAELDMKSAAIHCIGVYAKLLPLHFGPYLERSVEAVMGLLGYFHDDVRKNVIIALKHLTSVTYCLHPPEEPPAPGIPSNDTLQPQCRSAVDMLLTLYLQRIDAEDSKHVVSAICDSIAEVALEMGPVAVHNHMDALLKRLKELFQQKCLCQEEEDEEEELDEGEKDHDQILIDGVAELVDHLARAYGPGFASIWPEIAPDVLAYCSPKRPPSDHVMAVGTIAEVANHLKGAASAFFGQLFPVLLAAQESPEPGVRSNAAYGLGVLCLNCVDQARPHFESVLKNLQPLLGDGQTPEGTDNACAALARMLVADRAAAHADQVVPVFLQRLPLRKDFVENETVYGAVCFLLQHSPDLMRPHLPRVLSLFAHVCASRDVQEPVRNACVTDLQRLLNANPDVKELLGQLSQEEQEALRRYVF